MCMKPCDRCTDDYNRAQEKACSQETYAGNEEPLHRHHEEVA